MLELKLTAHEFRMRGALLGCGPGVTGARGCTGEAGRGEREVRGRGTFRPSSGSALLALAFPFALAACNPIARGRTSPTPSPLRSIGAPRGPLLPPTTGTRSSSLGTLDPLLPIALGTGSDGLTSGSTGQFGGLLRAQVVEQGGGFRACLVGYLEGRFGDRGGREGFLERDEIGVWVGMESQYGMRGDQAESESSPCSMVPCRGSCLGGGAGAR